MFGNALFASQLLKPAIHIGPLVSVAGTASILCRGRSSNRTSSLALDLRHLISAQTTHNKGNCGDFVQSLESYPIYLSARS